MTSIRLQLLTCLVLYASCAHAIMVKFGTRGGPIEPPPPEPPLPAPQPGRAPAPVWEERSNDQPDPNAHWRPQKVVPQPRYTNIAYQPPVNTAQHFVNAYIPRHKPIQAPAVPHYFTPSQILSSQSLPGFGIRYFIPEYMLHGNNHNYQQDDAKHNHIENNEIPGSSHGVHEARWVLEKEALARISKRVPPTPYPYQFPAYVPHQ